MKTTLSAILTRKHQNDKTLLNLLNGAVTVAMRKIVNQQQK